MMMTFQVGDTVMRKVEGADAAVMRIAMQQEIVRSEQSRYDHPLHGLLLVTGGRNCWHASELFGEDRRQCSVGLERLSKTDWMDGVRVNGQVARSRSPRSNGNDWRKI